MWKTHRCHCSTGPYPESWLWVRLDICWKIPLTCFKTSSRSPWFTCNLPKASLFCSTTSFCRHRALRFQLPFPCMKDLETDFQHGMVGANHHLHPAAAILSCLYGLYSSLLAWTKHLTPLFMPLNWSGRGTTPHLFYKKRYPLPWRYEWDNFLHTRVSSAGHGSMTTCPITGGVLHHHSEVQQKGAAQSRDPSSASFHDLSTVMPITSYTFRLTPTLRSSISLKCIFESCKWY